jgi:hypothetical protein
LSIEGRVPVSARKRSHTPSFTLSVANSRLESGERVAARSTRNVRAGLNRTIPVDGFRELVELVGAAIRAVRDLPEHAARDPRFEVDAVGEFERRSATHAAVRRGDVRAALRRELRGKRALEPARARDEEALAQRNRRRRVSTSAA